MKFLGISGRLSWSQRVWTRKIRQNSLLLYAFGRGTSKRTSSHHALPAMKCHCQDGGGCGTEIWVQSSEALEVLKCTRFCEEWHFFRAWLIKSEQKEGGSLEVSNPTSCSHQGWLQSWGNLPRALARCCLQISRNGDSISSLFRCSRMHHLL